MKVLVATPVPRSLPDGDFHQAFPGELVVPILDSAFGGYDECEVCSRGWVGIVSERATSTAVVAEFPGLTRATLSARVHEFLERDGLVGRVIDSAEAGEVTIDGCVVDDPVVAVEFIVDDYVRELIELADTFPCGAVLSRLGSLVSERTTPLAA